jgi:hypothetical protein
MYGGELTKVEITFDKSIIDVIYDKFGSDVRIACVADGWCKVSVKVVPSPVFFGWCCSLGNKVKLSGDIDDAYKRYIMNIVGTK